MFNLLIYTRFSPDEAAMESNGKISKYEENKS